MKITRGVKKVVKPFIDVPTWMGTGWITDHWRMIGGMYKSLYSRPENPYQEDFTMAMQRLHLTEADLQRRDKEFTYLLYIFGGLSLLMFCYTLYLLWDSSFKGALVSGAVAFMLFAQAFRYHFWRFQTRQRKLGCTFNEWFKGSFTGASQ